MNAAPGATPGGAGAGPQEGRQGQTLTPITVRMLNESVEQSRAAGAGGPDTQYLVSGRPLGLLTLVACVESVQQQPMFKDFRLNDGTGRVNVHRYVDGEATAEDFAVGQYVRIFGHVREWQGQGGVNAHRISAVESANEISHHAIEVAHVHLQATGKLRKPGAAPAPAAAAPAPAPGFGAGGGGGEVPSSERFPARP